MSNAAFRTALRSAVAESGASADGGSFLAAASRDGGAYAQRLGPHLRRRRKSWRAKRTA